MAEATDDKNVAVMMSVIRGLCPSDGLAINHRVKPESLEHVARRIMGMHGADADEAQIIASLARIHSERGGKEHFKTVRQLQREIDSRWNVTAVRYPSPSAVWRSTLKELKKQNA